MHRGTGPDLEGVLHLPSWAGPGLPSPRRRAARALATARPIALLGVHRRRQRVAKGLVGLDHHERGEDLRQAESSENEE